MPDKTPGQILHEARIAGGEQRPRPWPPESWADRDPQLKALDEAMAAAVEVAVRERVASEIEACVAAEYRYRNTLLWIRTIAGMHYFGGAFDPEHMRSITNMAANALGGKDLPDCEERARAAMARAREMVGKWAAMFDDPPGDDEEEEAR
jgi:hypothetical protein